MDIPNIENLHGNFLGKLYIKKHYPEFYEYLINRYKHISWTKFSELLYCYYHELNDRPRCKCCDDTVNFISFNDGYRTYCSTKCLVNDSDIQDQVKSTRIEHYGGDMSEIVKKSKQTKKERYGDPNYNNPEKNKKTKTERYGNPYYLNRTKAKQTCLERYGVEVPMKNKDICEKSIQTRKRLYGENNITNHSKCVQTCMDRYGVENVFQLDEVKEKTRKTCREKYGEDFATRNKNARDISDITQQKIYNTNKINGTFSSSSIELSFKQWLDDNNIKYVYQYKSDEYPFNCDFYFPETKYFLEIQGTWTHGDHPFNPSDENDIAILNNWRDKNSAYYNNAIYVWTISDPMKRDFAKKHGLNWTEVFTNDLNDLIILNIW